MEEGKAYRIVNAYRYLGRLDNLIWDLLNFRQLYVDTVKQSVEKAYSSMFFWEKNEAELSDYFMCHEGFVSMFFQQNHEQWDRKECVLWLHTDGIYCIFYGVDNLLEKLPNTFIDMSYETGACPSGMGQEVYEARLDKWKEIMPNLIPATNGLSFLIADRSLVRDALWNLNDQIKYFLLKKTEGDSSADLGNTAND